MSTEVSAGTAAEDAIVLAGIDSHVGPEHARVARVEDFARRHDFAELAWPGGAAPFLNVNTPAEFDLASKRLASSFRDRKLSKR